MSEIVMSGLDGGNPLGFLAAIGTFRTLSDAMPGNVKMSWRQEMGGWRPCLVIEKSNDELIDQMEFADFLARLLGVPAKLPDDEILNQTKMLEKIYRTKRNALIEKEKKLKKYAKDNGINGRDDLVRYMAENTKQDREEVGEQRKEWLYKLSLSVISLEMGLGKTLSVTPDEIRKMATNVATNCHAANRLVVDLVSAFGSEVCVKNNFIEYTPFCFVTGSGQQFFLETIQKLMSVVTAEHLFKTLFRTWSYDDLRFSLRWDPADDRRYALMWDDPTSQGNESKTMWAANLLGYRALSVLPSFPVGTSLKTTSFAPNDQTFSWPIWTVWISLDTLRSLMSMESLIQRPVYREKLEAMGVAEIYQSTRIQVGTPPLVKTNFSQSVVA